MSDTKADAAPANNAPVFVQNGLDIITTSRAVFQAAAAARNLGGGIFAEPSALKDLATLSGSIALATGDVNGDGFLDVLTVNGNEGVSVSLNRGDGTFQPASRAATGITSQPYSGGIIRDIAVGDIDSDGHLDLIVIDAVDGGRLLLGNGDGTFDPPKIVSTGGLGPMTAIEVADMNSDGRLDIVMTGYQGHWGTVRLGNGDGTFQANQHVLIGDRRLADLTVADLDGNGDLDIIIAGAGGASITLATGTGTFFAPKGIETGGQHDSIATGDIDRDGDIDILLGTQDALTLLVNDGSGRFAAPETISTLPGSGKFATLGDIDGDGSLDIVAMGVLPGGSAAFNNGDGTFGSAFPIAGISGRPLLVDIDPGAQTSSIAYIGQIWQGKAGSISGALRYRDTDVGDTHTVTSYYVGPGSAHGALTATLDGGSAQSGTVSLEYTVDPALLRTLKPGETKFETFDISLSDGTDVAHQTVAVLLRAAPLISGSGGRDNLVGTRADELLDAGKGNDRVDAGAGDDTIYASAGDGNDIYIGGDGIDTLDLSAITGASTVDLGPKGPAAGRAMGKEIGSDTLKWIENVLGGSGNDTIRGSSVANSLDGGAGNDTISGFAGNDIIIGGHGNDRLSGGVGHDTFVFHGGFGTDTITDFSAKVASTRDKLRFDTTLFSDLADLIAHSSQVGSALVITSDAGDTLTLKNMKLEFLNIYNSSIVEFV